MNLVNSQNLFTIIQRLTILGKDKFVDEEEGRYMRQIDALAREIVENGISMVLLAGPSGSGKTTTAHNLRKCLMRRLMETDRYVYCLSMDDWYMSGDRYTMPLDEEATPTTSRRVPGHSPAQPGPGGPAGRKGSPPSLL